jgi:hypothetical protein
MQPWTPDQQRTTPQARRAAQHPGNATERSSTDSEKIFASCRIAAKLFVLGTNY